MTLASLVILAITLFLLTVYSIVQANAKVFGLSNSPFLPIKLLDTASAASLFVTLVGALLVRHQFAVGVQPRINYKSTRAERHNKQSPGQPFETWRVELRNTGLGAAIVNRAEYFLKPADVKDYGYHCTREEVLKELATLDLVADRDYWIENITNGFTLSPKDDCFVFEIKMEHVDKLSCLDMVLYFQSQLGNKYRRLIMLAPRS